MNCKTLSFLFLCIVSISLNGMEKTKQRPQPAEETYQVYVARNVFNVSKNIVLASPLLQMLQEKIGRTSIFLALAKRSDFDEFFSKPGTVDIPLLEQYVAHEKKAEFIQQLNVHGFNKLQWLLCAFEMEDLLKIALDAFITDLTKTTAPTLALSVSPGSKGTVEDLHRDLDALASSLAAKHPRTRSLVKELITTTKHYGNVRLTLFLSLMDKLDPYKAIKLGWRAILAEPDDLVREVLFDEVAYLIQKNSMKGSDDDEAISLEIPELLFCPKIDTKAGGIGFIRAKLKFLYAVLKKLKDGTSKPFINITSRSYNDLPVFMRLSGNFLVHHLRLIRRKIGQVSFKTTAEQIDQMLILLNHTFTKMASDLPDYASFGAHLDFLAFSGYKHDCPSAVLSAGLLDAHFVQISSAMCSCLFDRQSQGFPSLYLGEIKIERPSLHDYLKTLFYLLLQGASVNATDENGDTIAHKTFSLVSGRANTLWLLDFLVLLKRNGFPITMHAKNSQGETPLSLLHKISFVPQVNHHLFNNAEKQDEDNLSIHVGTAAQLLEVDLAPHQQEKFMAVAQALDRGYRLHNLKVTRPRYIVKQITKTQEFQRAVIKLQSALDPEFLYREVKEAWQVALGEKNEARSSQLLKEISKITSLLKRTERGVFYKGELVAENPHAKFPALLCGCADTKRVFHLVKKLKNKTVLLSEVVDEIEPIDLIELLQFSNCFMNCFAHLERSNQLGERLTAAARRTMLDTRDSNPILTFILKGADLNAQDDEGNTLCHHAILRGNVLLLEALITIFKDFIDLDKQNNNGCTPLILAAQHETEATDFVGILVDAIANAARDEISPFTRRMNIRAVDNQGFNALHYYLIRGFSTTHACYNLVRLMNQFENFDYQCPCKQQKCAAALKKMRDTIENPYAGPTAPATALPASAAPATAVEVMAQAASGAAASNVQPTLNPLGGMELEQLRKHLLPAHLVEKINARTKKIDQDELL